MALLTNIRDVWNSVGTGGRAGLMLGLLLILAGLMWAGSGMLRTPYGVLFSGLDAQDAASIVAELDRMKVPYRFGQDESTIQVRQDQVHATRLKLMGKGVALRGGVGFEIFNNTDFGMTEFAQKINFQRALQGELARTIMAFDEVQSARVHLVLPESGLFRKADQQPKASITVALKRDRGLRAEQVSGIQRLVAASVPEIRQEAVTVLDQRGVALSRAADAAGDEGAAGARITIKHDIETYLARKVVSVLDGTFGPGKALVSVDVTVNHDQVSVTQEDVLPAAGQHGEATGVVVRRRLSVQGAPGAAIAGAQPAQWPSQDASGSAGASNQEVEYQSGRRIEQIVSRPGSIRRISLAVMLPHALSPERVEEIRQVLSMAVGLSSARGDEIAISSVDRFAENPGAVLAPSASGESGAAVDAGNPASTHSAPEPATRSGGGTASPVSSGSQVSDSAQPPAWSLPFALGAVIAAVVVIAAALAGWSAWRQRRERQRTRQAEREQVLQDLRQWLRGDTERSA